MSADAILYRFQAASKPPRVLKHGLGGDVYLVYKDGTPCVLKMGDPAIISAERQQYTRLRGLLEMPLVLEAGEGYLILDYIRGRSFFDDIPPSNGNGLILAEEFYRSFEALAYLWHKTRRNDERGISGARIQQPGLASYLEDRYQMAYFASIIINGRDSGLSLADIVGWLNVGFRRSAPFSVCCHGDPRGDNIIRADGRFVFVDPRPGYTDWIDDATFWARFRLLIHAQLGVPHVAFEDGVLTVAYQAFFPPPIETLEKQALGQAESFASLVGDERWKERWAVAMVSSLLREIRATEQRIKRGIIAPPVGFDAFLIGEAVRYILNFS